MLPIISTASYIPPASFVNTAVLGSATVHVPVDTVAPSVSNAQVNNNARANNDAVAMEAGSDAVASPDTVSVVAAGTGSASPAFASGNQTAFVTQLLAQDASPGTAGPILVQYEALVALSNIKYKPSNALKPSGDEPSASFGRILSQATQTTGNIQLAPQDTVTSDKATLPAIPQAAPVETHVTTASDTAIIVPQAFTAYVASVARPAQTASTQVEVA